MIPAAILLIILVGALVILIAWAIGVVNGAEQRMDDRVQEAIREQAKAIVKVSDYERDQSDLRYELKRIRSWAKVPDEYKAI